MTEVGFFNLNCSDEASRVQLIAILHVGSKAIISLLCMPILDAVNVGYV